MKFIFCFFMFCFSLLKLSFYILCLSFKFYKYLYEEMFLTPDYSWVTNSTNPTSLALPFTLLPHSMYFVIKKFGRKHWAHEHDCFHTSFPLSFFLLGLSLCLSHPHFLFPLPKELIYLPGVLGFSCPQCNFSVQMLEGKGHIWPNSWLEPEQW